MIDAFHHATHREGWHALVVAMAVHSAPSDLKNNDINANAFIAIRFKKFYKLFTFRLQRTEENLQRNLKSTYYRSCKELFLPILFRIKTKRQLLYPGVSPALRKWGGQEVKLIARRYIFLTFFMSLLLRNKC